MSPRLANIRRKEIRGGECKGAQKEGAGKMGINPSVSTRIEPEKQNQQEIYITECAGNNWLMRWWELAWPARHLQGRPFRRAGRSPRRSLQVKLFLPALSSCPPPHPVLVPLLLPTFLLQKSLSFYLRAFLLIQSGPLRGS